MAGLFQTVQKEAIVIIAGDVEKEKEFTAEQIEGLEKCLLQELAVENIAKILEKPQEAVQAQINKIYNPTKVPIGEAEGSSPDSWKFHYPPTDTTLGKIYLRFNEASFSLDSNHHLVRDLPESDPRSRLYAGACTCEGADHSDRTINLKVMGESGHGKSTHINAFLNYVFGVTIYDKFRYLLHDDESLAKERAGQS